jgi:CelD/BcsL family acetyltransferase involved in cellulose biosynthesis
MPLKCGNYQNPFIAFKMFRSANSTYITNLTSDFDALLQSKRSSSSIKSIKKRDRRLSEMGKVQLINEPISRTSLNFIIQNKNQQLASQGIRNVFSESVKKFLNRASKSETAKFHNFELRLNGKYLSGMLGVEHKDCFYPMIITLSPSAPLQVSPGDILLRFALKWACEHGLKKVDFAMGNASFKEIWADEIVELFHCFQTRNIKGILPAIALMVLNVTKRKIKNSGASRTAFNSARQFLLSKKI